MTSIFWFRRDLRLTDQPALVAAAAAGPVLPVFVFDDQLAGSAGANRLAFLNGSLASLDADIGGNLVIRSGDPARVLAALAHEIEAEAVYATDDFGPYGRDRDTNVGGFLASQGLAVHYRDSPYAIPPNSIVTGAGTPFKVFTPFFRAWKAHGWAEPSGRAVVDWVSGIRSEPARDTHATAAWLPEPGERAAWDRVDAFLDGPVFDYESTRNAPGVDATSRLSAYLKWGTVHPRQLLARLGPDPAEEVFRSELCWREFYAEVLFQRPETARTAYAQKMSTMEVDRGELAEERFAAWCAGRTGYPLVDAGMRQLVAEGWMHNRVRMIVASFLVKDLHIDWRRGARFFMEHLVDGDLASNQHGWQWVAGTGTDASPYFRVFNPVSQSRRFDPHADYIRRWIPEIEHLGDKAIHEPWTEPAGAPAGYPAPIVDHAVERAESLARYSRLKESWSGS